MERKDDGGPAFPCTNEQFTHGNPTAGDAWPGLSLRDWFAGQALACLKPSERAFEHMANDGLGPDDVNVIIARTAYCLADAMLAARKADRT